ncbi:hypothetical protein V7150_09755 [Neobacillus drentensis]|uniref:hypothetical protein n=1 Tax=Neobacillus drentensis TaxID=220684 RepID=UPI002FFF47A2
MNNVQQIINSIKNNDISKDELIFFLDNTNILIKANAIFQIVRMQMHDEIFIEKLVNLARLMEEEPKVIGLYNNAHFALAALSWLGTENSIKTFTELFEKLEPEKQSVLRKLIEEKPYLYL